MVKKKHACGWLTYFVFCCFAAAVGVVFVFPYIYLYDGILTNLTINQSRKKTGLYLNRLW